MYLLRTGIWNKCDCSGNNTFRNGMTLFFVSDCMFNNDLNGF